MSKKVWLLVASRWVDRNESSEFATEHLLLALLLTEDDTSRWLAERGLTAESLQPEIEQRDGQSLIDAPLDLPSEEVSKTSQIPEPTSERSATEVAVWRVIDASANCAGEGLRVVEDYVRFVLDDALLTRQWKQLRHDLTQTLERFDTSRRMAARDTVADVGTSISTAQEQTRNDPATLAAANISRLQEALRSLEEYAKLIDPVAAAGLRAASLSKLYVAVRDRDHRATQRRVGRRAVVCTHRRPGNVGRVRDARQ